MKHDDPIAGQATAALAASGVPTPAILEDPRLARLMAMLEGGDARAYLVGGCVRDHLADRPVNDIDISVDLDPEAVTRRLRKHGVRVEPTGIDHGTVTAIVYDARTPETGDHPAFSTFEVTSFRRDVETDGRRAVVAFTRDIREDAMRRDLTINALYMDRRGDVLDPTGQGLPDLAARRVRFIADPGARIREDALRILRLFRFSARFGAADAASLQAALDHAPLIDTLSRERVGDEAMKILALPDPFATVATMVEGGIFARILPCFDHDALAALGRAETAAAPFLEMAACASPEIVSEPGVRRLAALIGSAEVVAPGDDAALVHRLHDHLRLSRAASLRVRRILRVAEGAMGFEEIGYRFGARDAVDGALVRTAIADRGARPPADLSAALERVMRGTRETMPVTARDLDGRFTGAAIGNALRDMERRFVASGFMMGKEALIASLE